MTGGKLSVRLRGGLGNVLFQLASAWSIAEKHNKEFFIDKKEILHHCKKRHEFLNHVATNSDTNYSKTVHEKGCDWSKCIDYNVSGDNVLMLGYFQNSNYFIPETADFLKSLDLFRTVDTEKLRSRINDNSFFIHVRRGDFVNNSYHFIDLTDYYKEAVQRIKQSYPNAQFVVASDDIDSVKKQFPDLPDTTWFLTDLDQYETLYLMTQCRGGVCANSTFSWWGAYLNERPDKKIYMPKKWLNNDSVVDIWFPGAVVLDV